MESEYLIEEVLAESTLELEKSQLKRGDAKFLYFMSHNIERQAIIGVTLNLVEHLKFGCFRREKSKGIVSQTCLNAF